jgi:hypothetical protein
MLELIQAKATVMRNKQKRGGKVAFDQAER